MLVMSSTTRLTSGTPLVIQVEMRHSTSCGTRDQSAVIASHRTSPAAARCSPRRPPRLSRPQASDSPYGRSRGHLDSSELRRTCRAPGDRRLVHVETRRARRFHHGAGRGDASPELRRLPNPPERVALDDRHGRGRFRAGGRVVGGPRKRQGIGRHRAGTAYRCAYAGHSCIRSLRSGGFVATVKQSAPCRPQSSASIQQSWRYLRGAIA